MCPGNYAETVPKAGDVEDRINHVLRIAPADPAPAPAVGGGRLEVRYARIVGFAEILYYFGNEFTAAELHAYWCNCRRLCTRRAHPWTNPDRKAATRAHHAATGRWGLGRGVGIGEVAWSGRIPRDSKGKGKRKGKGEKKGDA